MTVSIHQPAYLPWLGYFERIVRSDLHVVLDHVQFEKNSFINRNRIRTRDGWMWLTVPVLTRGRFGDLSIRELRIDNTQRWAEKHWRAIAQNYARAPQFERHAAFLEDCYATRWDRMIDLAAALRDYLLDALAIRTPLRSSSEMQPRGVKSDLVLELCRECSAKTYLSGAQGRGYLDEPAFAAAGIRITYQDYRHPRYAQAGGPGFEPNMSALDLLLNHGSASHEILLRGGARQEALA